MLLVYIRILDKRHTHISFILTFCYLKQIIVVFVSVTIIILSFIIVVIIIENMQIFLSSYNKQYVRGRVTTYAWK